jgi:hypothetical protein
MEEEATSRSRVELGRRDFPGLPLNCGPCFCVLGAYASLYLDPHSGRVHEWGQWVVPVEVVEEGPEQPNAPLPGMDSTRHPSIPHQTTKVVRRPCINLTPSTQHTLRKSYFLPKSMLIAIGSPKRSHGDARAHEHEHHLKLKRHGVVLGLDLRTAQAPAERPRVRFQPVHVHRPGRMLISASE